MRTNKANALIILERAVSRATGENVDDIRAMTIDERRKFIQAKKSHPPKFMSKFPLIGRGNILRDGIKNRDQINAELDEALNG